MLNSVKEVGKYKFNETNKRELIFEKVLNVKGSNEKILTKFYSDGSCETNKVI